MNTSAMIFDHLFRGFNSNLTPCFEWRMPQHIFLQLANLFLFIGLFFSSTSLYSLIFLRSMLLVSNLLTILWTWLIVCSGDLLIWQGAFAIINLGHIVILIVKLHPCLRFPHEIEMAYRNLFRPLGVSRVDFQRLYSYTRGIQTIKPKDIYAMEDQTVVDRLSLLLSGRVSVVRGGVTRHIVDCYQFLESPEWFGMNSSDKYQVSIVALEESQLLVWNRDKLKLSISSDRYLQIILDHILGRDIVKKLMLSLDIDSANMSSEKTKLIQTNFPMDQIISLNTIQDNNSHCFWNLSSNTFEMDAHETSL
ncbi:hypothetical protein TYRP_003263 [Tyrophagus putrescentiae]|nr:hypothetical protein TYRP_003263 [Tyrophagus putrescentiae]